MDVDVVFEAVKRNDFERVKQFLEKENVPPTVTKFGRETLAYVAGTNDNWKILKYVVDKDPSTLADTWQRHFVLQRAIKRAPFDIVKYLVEKYQMDVNGLADDDDDEPPLFLAMKYQRRDIVQYFIDVKKADLTRQNGARENLLYKVVLAEDDVEFAKYLLDKKKVQIDVDHRNQYGETLVFLAVLNNRTATIKYLVGQKHANVNIPDERYGRTPLHCAVFKNHFEICKYLVDQGAEVNHRDHNGTTSLDCAASPKILEYLIEHGANVNTSRTNNCNRTPLLMAALLNRHNVCNYLLEQHGADIKQVPLFLMVSKKRAKICECLVEHGANVNQKNYRGETPLHLTVRKKIDPLSKYLIHHGADINQKNNKGETPLHYSILKGSQEMLEYIIAAGACVNEKNNDGNSPMHYAVIGGHLEMCKYLIKHGADVNEKNDDGKTPLHYAIVEKHLEILKCLLKHGADINKTDDEGKTSLCYAIIGNQLDIFDCLIEHGANINKANNDGRTPLYYAIVGRQYDMFKSLIAKGASINEGDRNGETPLHHTITRNAFEMFKYLIEHGANVNRRNNHGKSILSYAIEGRQLEMCKMLVERNVDVDANLVHRAFVLSSYDIVYYLIANVPSGMDMNQRDKNGETLLHLAVSKKQEEIIKALTTKGVDMNAKDKHEATPLHYCLTSKVCKYLIEHGADINQTNSVGKTILHKVARDSDAELCKYLLKHGADVNCADKTGQSPLHEAIYYGKIDNVKTLLTYGARIDQATKEGNTTLHLAARYGGENLEPCHAMLKFLIEQNVSNIEINAENVDGQTPLHVAASSRYCLDEKTKYLVVHGADVNHKDKEGNTALHIACQWGKERACEILLENGAKVNSQNLDGRSPLHNAVPWGHIKLLLRHGANVNLKDKKGNTPLHLAARFEELCPKSQFHYILESLVKHKDNININMENINGETPLHYAVGNRRCDEEIIKYLITNGALINYKNKRGETPLYYGLKDPVELDKIKYLVENGADVNSCDIDGSTPLHSSLSRSFYEQENAVRYLIKHGSDINKANNRGETPVHLASKLFENDILRYLVGNQHANINVARKGDLWTPLHCAAFWNRRDCCQYLIKQGADIHAKDKDGRTPAELASEKRLIEYMRKATETKRSRRRNETTKKRSHRSVVEYPTLILDLNSLPYNNFKQHQRIGKAANVLQDVHSYSPDTAIPAHNSIPLFQLRSFLTLSSVLFQNSDVSTSQRSQIQSRIIGSKRAFIENKMDSSAEIAINALPDLEVS